MVETEDLISEQIETLKTYIQLLERIKKIVWGFRLSKNERVVMEIVEGKVGLAEQLLAVVAGLGAVIVGMGLGRIIARSPWLLVMVVLVSGMAGICLAIFIYARARRQVAEQEIRLAQLEIYRLLNQQPDA